MHELQKRNPGKKFYAAGNMQICPNMKKITLDKIIAALENNAPSVTLKEDFMKQALAPMVRMLELAK